MDSDAVFNLRFLALLEILGLMPISTFYRVTTTENVFSKVFETFWEPSIKFSPVQEHSNVLIVSGTQFEVITRCLVVEAMQARLDVRKQEITMNPRCKEVTLGLDYEKTEPLKIDTLSDKDYKDFTSDIETSLSGSGLDDDERKAAYMRSCQVTPGSPNLNKQNLYFDSDLSEGEEAENVRILTISMEPAAKEQDRLEDDEWNQQVGEGHEAPLTSAAADGGCPSFVRTERVNREIVINDHFTDKLGSTSPLDAEENDIDSNNGDSTRD